jgi:hypothetical protein
MVVVDSGGGVAWTICRVDAVRYDLVKRRQLKVQSLSAERNRREAGAMTRFCRSERGETVSRQNKRSMRIVPLMKSTWIVEAGTYRSGLRHMTAFLYEVPCQMQRISQQQHERRPNATL